MGFIHGDYAQKNIIKLKDNSEELIPADEGVFLISNTTLNGSKELFEIEFATGRNIFYYAGYVDTQTIVVPTYSEDKAEFQGTPTQVFNYANYKAITIEDGIGFTRRVIMRTVATTPLQSSVDTYYGSLQSILRNAKILTLKFNLSIIDIANLDFYTPIYLGQYGSYFYINKINNYVLGQLTSVELIKI